MQSLATSPKVQPIRKPIRKPAKRRIPAARLDAMSAVEQVTRAFAPAQRLAAVMGFLLGGFIPVATFVIVHYEVATYPALWVLVVGGLAYSAISVYKWAKMAFQMIIKAAGFVLLLEGVVTFAHTPALPYVGLAVLIAINGISAAVALQTKPR